MSKVFVKSTGSHVQSLKDIRNSSCVPCRPDPRVWVATGETGPASTHTYTNNDRSSELRSCVKVSRGGGRPGLIVPCPNSPHGLCGRRATLNLNLISRRWSSHPCRLQRRRKNPPHTAIRFLIHVFGWELRYLRADPSTKPAWRGDTT